MRIKICLVVFTSKPLGLKELILNSSKSKYYRKLKYVKAQNKNLTVLNLLFGGTAKTKQK